jgi:EF-hand domain-containing protein 1
MGFFNEAVTESRSETFRRRIVVLRYFLEDDTFEIFEQRRRNDGMHGAKFLNRQQHDAVSLDTLRVGTTLVLYSRAFRITACDEFTRTFFLERGEPQPEDLELPSDTFGTTMEREVARTAGWNGKTTNSISRYVEAVRGKAVKKKDTLSKFLTEDGHELRFFACWDQTIKKHDVFAMKQHFTIKFFLVDDTVELTHIRLPHERKTLDPLRFLSRRRMPKSLIVHDDRERSCEDGTGDEDYFTAADFRVGQVASIYSKDMLIYDCDDFTQKWCLENLGVDQKANAIDLSEPPKAKVVLPPPPHIGIGSEEDTLHSWKYLSPQQHPRKSDYKRFLESKGKTLKFFCRLDSTDPIDSIRQYRITWYLDDDTLAVYESEVRNAGLGSGKWQARTKMVNVNTGKPFVSNDFFVGAIVTIKRHRFIIEGADDFSLRFMEDSSALWPMSSLDFVLSKLKGKLQEKSASLRKMFRKFDEDKSQSISLAEFQRMLDYFGMSLSKQECVTIFRAFDSDGQGFIDYEEFMRAFSDADDEAAADAAHVDTAAARMSSEEERSYFARAESADRDMQLHAATDLLLARLARSMKQAKSAQAVHENFRKFDSNKDHTIDRDEFHRAMGDSGFYLTPKDIALLEERFYPPGADSMNYEDFMSILHEYADKTMIRS